MRIVIAYLIGFILGMCILIAHAEEKPKGKSKICDDIGYLSTSCQEVDILPFEYKDKDVALEKAKQQITETITNTNVTVDTNKEKESKEKEDVIVKTWFEETKDK